MTLDRDDLDFSSSFREKRLNTENTEKPKSAEDTEEGREQQGVVSLWPL